MLQTPMQMKGWLADSLSDKLCMDVSNRVPGTIRHI